MPPLRYYLTIRARTKKTAPMESLHVCTVKLTPTTRQVLSQLSQEASDRLGWTVSKSALLRALLTYAEQQPAAWVATALVPLVEQEIAHGRVWGKK
jgi:hypothetical protein